MPNIISDNPALIVGFVRALLVAAVAFGAHLSTTQQDAILALVLATVSLLATFATVKLTVPKTPSVDAKPSAIQVPPPTA